MATGSGQPLPPPSSPAPPTPPAYPPMIIVLTIILLVLFFVGFFSIYFCRCFMQNILCTWHLRHNPTATPVGGANASSAAAGGLDPLIVQSFPTFAYSTVKDYRKERYGLECAICLIEFQGMDVLRLMTRCCHVFHQECVDLWLESHKTCPVCRRNLDSPVQSPVKSPAYAGDFMHDENELPRVEDDFRITIKDDDDDDDDDKLGQRVSCSNVNNGEKGDGDHATKDACDQVEKFSKSHSTGHSLARDYREREEDRYTLRLPEHVDIMGGHNSSKSWTNFGEYKERANTRNVGVAESSELSSGDNKV